MTAITATTTTNPAKAKEADTAPSKTNTDYDTFLKMLTAQVQNQDPLNPIDSADYAVQLATFSGVEQQVKTNDLLTDLNAQMGLSGISNLAGWVGQEVRSTGTVPHDGTTPLSLSLSPEPRADQAVLVAVDASGTEVSRTPVPVAGGDYSWPPSGTTVAAGDYSFRLESYRAGTQIGDGTDVPVWRRVDEVRTGDSGSEVVFSDGRSALASTVTGLRAPVAR
jgi:flagellar basal-body rod modification protein FlgD